MSTKAMFLGAVTIIGVGAAGYASLRSDAVGPVLHEASHTIGLCSVDHAAAAVAACANGNGCALPSSGVSLTETTADEKKVVAYISDRIVAEGSLGNFTPEEIKEATGVSVEEMDPNRLQAAVLAELNRRKVNISDLMGSSYCSKFSACSVDRDLSGARGEELQRYFAEKAQDGATYTDWMAPDFTLPNTAGERVQLSDYRGRPVALVFLAGHCSHSLDTLPILSELEAKYEARGLALLPVYVNSGSVDDVREWTSELSLNFFPIVSKSKEISRAFDSRMVPSTFLIDKQGRVVQRLVGFKDKDTLDRAFAELVNS